MKVLLVAMSDSIHTARWIESIHGKGIEVYLFPSTASDSLHNRENVKKFYSQSFFNINTHDGKLIERTILHHYFNSFLLVTMNCLNKLVSILSRYSRMDSLAKVISNLQPDIIHSLEIQSAGYLVNEVKKIIKTNFPLWIVTNWGSDISLFGSDPSHANKIREVLSECDYYSCECVRDLKLARKFGFKGKFLEVMPNAGGYDLTRYKKYSLMPPSKRKYIMVKGYQGWAGRSLVALEALDSIGHVLHEKKYGLIIYSMAGNIEVEKRAKEVAEKHSLKLKLIPQFTPHDAIIKLHAESRISIGLSMGDGISTSLLESMLTGSFPIQSYTACADEWIVDGHTGILVPPEDQNLVKHAILRAIESDSLVDKAAKLNLHTIKERADYNMIRKQVLELYNTVIKESQKS